MTRRGPLDRLRAFAVEDTAVQLTWGHLNEEELQLRVGDTTRIVDGRGGSTSFDGLEPDTDYAVEVSGGDPPLTVRTLPPPPGPELYRFATVSDLHVGMDYFDFRQWMREDVAPGEDLHPVRCTSAALRELEAWGAQRVVVKGDVTEQGLPSQWRTAGALLRSTMLPLDLIPGNHDRWDADGAARAFASNQGRAVKAGRAAETAERPVDADEGTALAELPIHRGVEHVDIPGARLVFVETPVPGRHLGAIGPERARAAADAVRAAPTGIVIMHHQLQALRAPHYWPPGVPYRDAQQFVDALVEANPRVLVTSGHTHRHRRRDLGPIVTTEVGSVKDYPGTWAGYVVHEGGIRQVVRRIESPSCVEWLERTRGAALRRWGRWSPGRLEDRCFSHPWPPPAAGAPSR